VSSWNWEVPLRAC